MSDKWPTELGLLQDIKDKLQTIIDNQERQYKLDLEYINENKQEQQKKWEQLTSHMPNFSNVDFSQVFNMAQKSMDEISQDKRSFDFGIVRKPARKYDESELGLEIKPEDIEKEKKKREGDKLGDVDSS